MRRRISILIFSFFFSFGILSGATAARELSRLCGVIHVHSTHSSGHYSIEELVSRAKQKGIEVLVLTDHDQMVMEYGLFPFRNLIKKREERKSVLQAGPEHYLAEISRLNKQQKAVLIIPGVQSSPFYYWSGNPLRGGLTAHDYRKELLLVGLFVPEDYYRLPLLHGGFSTRYTKEFVPRVIVFFTVLLLSLYLIFQKGKLRIFGYIIAILSVALMVNHHPFKSSRFDQYHGDRGIAPYQEVIDYVRSRGGLVFWAHPESNYSNNSVQLGPIKLMTQPYPDDLLESKNYTGFSAIYGDNTSATKAGMHWDRILNEYCEGRRARPVWGIAGSDFHVEKKGVDLDTFQTVFLVEGKRTEDVLQALSRGRIYAVHKPRNFYLVLDKFQIKDQATGNTARMGDELLVKALPVVEGRISESNGGSGRIEVAIIRGGKRIRSLEGETPLDFRIADKDRWSGKTFYRLEVRGKTAGQLLSNPIFVSRN